ncbi:unnamed protein product [Linum trigynum]|uniref:RNase H type-1 domain-containing protein n=1 Tax=Linum trigynum TaxID=586398 RepID=A0AAV2DQ00_9ROSI
METIIERTSRLPEDCELDPGIDGHGAAVDPKCPVCWEPLKTLEHMFLSCRLALELWERSGLGTSMVRQPPVNFALFLRRFFEQETNVERIIRFVALLWRIWKSRNWVVFDQVQFGMSTLVRQFEEQVREWLALIESGNYKQVQEQQGRGESGGVKGLQPAMPYCCFVDGAVLDGSHGAGGMVVYDGLGRVCFVQGFRYAGLVDPFLVELVAFRDAVQCRSLKGLVEVQFCGDAKVAIDKIQTRDARDVKGGRILEEIRKLRHFYQRFEVAFVGRSNNRVAHEVVRKTLSLLPASVDTFDFYRWFAFEM